MEKYRSTFEQIKKLKDEEVYRILYATPNQPFFLYEEFYARLHLNPMQAR